MPAIVVGRSCPLAEVIWRTVEGMLQVPFWPFVHGESSRGDRPLQLCSPGSPEGGLTCTMAQAALRRSVRGSGAGAGLQAGDGAQVHWEDKKYVGESFLHCWYGSQCPLSGCSKSSYLAGYKVTQAFGLPLEAWAPSVRSSVR